MVQKKRMEAGAIVSEKYFLFLKRKKKMQPFLFALRRKKQIVHLRRSAEAFDI